MLEVEGEGEVAIEVEFVAWKWADFAFGLGLSFGDVFGAYLVVDLVFVEQLVWAWNRISLPITLSVSSLTRFPARSSSMRARFFSRALTSAFAPSVARSFQRRSRICSVRLRLSKWLKKRLASTPKRLFRRSRCTTDPLALRAVHKHSIPSAEPTLFHSNDRLRDGDFVCTA
jgi:hypothetical protein